jgi:transposase
MEQLDYNLLYRWFVGLGVDEAVWVPTVFTKNRDRLLEAAVARGWLECHSDTPSPHFTLWQDRPLRF